MREGGAVGGGVLRVTVRAEQRLALGIGAEVSYFTDSHAFVPGSVLRGALAAAWIAEHGPPTGDPALAGQFRELFDGQVRYGPLEPIYPGPSGGRSPRAGAGSYRVPLSVLRCAYPGSAECGRFAVDLAFAARPDGGCPHCDGPLRPSRGGLELPASVRMERSVRTSIDPATGRAKDGELYATAALPAGTVLTGTIHGLHPWLIRPRTLRLGGRRTVGGAADYRAEPAAADPHPWQAPQPGPAVTAASAASAAPAAADTADTADTAHTSLVLRLLTPAVFVDEAGRPRLDPDPRLDLPPGVTVGDRWVRVETWGGWHAASQLPKPTEVCVAAGSTYLLAGPPRQLAALATRVAAAGLGLRRTEGLGIVEIATAPWRLPSEPAEEPPDAPPAVATGTPLAVATGTPPGGVDGGGPDGDRHAWLTSLALDEEQRRWLIGALRGLQVEASRCAHRAVPGPAVERLLSQPTAIGLTGRQRQLIHRTLVGMPAARLRDLTTVLDAPPAPAAGYGAPAPAAGYGAPAPAAGHGAPAAGAGHGGAAPAAGHGAPAADPAGRTPPAAPQVTDSPAAAPETAGFLPGDGPPAATTPPRGRHQ